MFDMNDFISELRYLKGLETKYEALLKDYEILEEKYENIIRGNREHNTQMLGSMLEILTIKAGKEKQS